MVDFSRLALRPAMLAFGRPITVTPLLSQPGAPTYAARAVWTVRATSVVLENGEQLSTENRTFSLRLSEFPIAPQPGDLISAPAFQSQPEVPSHIIDGVDADGEGNAVCAMKAWTP